MSFKFTEFENNIFCPLNITYSIFRFFRIGMMQSHLTPKTEFGYGHR